MRKRDRLTIEQSEVREKLNGLLAKDEMTEDERGTLGTLSKRAQEIEVELRAAILAEPDPAESTTETPDAEMRERLELRSRATVGAYLRAALSGRAVSGAESELAQAAGVDGIPFELFEPAPENRQREERAISPAPSTVGIGLDPIRPAVFAPSVTERLMIDMPMVGSGTYATGTITTSATAGAVAKSAEVPQSAAAITVGTTTPHRIGASLGLALEDIASIGTGNFESVLRENLSLVLSDELDSQVLNGNGSSNDLTGIFQRLTDPTAPAANVETWERFLKIQASGIEGLWASELSHIAMVVGPETYRLAATTFQGTDAEQSAAMYMKSAGAGFWTNKRMPAKSSHVQQGIMCRKGRSGMRTAVCPHWGYIGIDDIYTGARKGERYFTISVLVGDVILVQSDAYAQVAFRVSA